MFHLFSFAFVSFVLSYCSLAKSCPTLCDPMDCSMPGVPVSHHLQKFAQAHVSCFGDAIQPSHFLTPSSPLPSIFPRIRGFPMSQLFTSGGQSTGASASVSVLPMNIQGWSHPRQRYEWIKIGIKPEVMGTDGRLPAFWNRSPTIHFYTNLSQWADAFFLEGLSQIPVIKNSRAIRFLPLMMSQRRKEKTK